MSRWRSPYFWLILVLMTALFSRSYQFGSIPTGVNRDEASIGYTADLLLRTGQEEHRISWPPRFESFGDWKQPVYIYFTIPFIYLLGLSEVSVRLLSLMAGMVMILVAYLLTSRLVGQPDGRWAGVMAAFLLAFNPWHFHFTHLALEAMVAATWFCGAIWLLDVPTNRRQLLGLGALLMSMLTYHAALVVVPIWFIWFLISMRRERVKPVVKWLWIAFGLISLIILNQAWFSGQKAKVTGITIFYMTPYQKWQSIYQYRDGGVISKLTHNQYLYWAKTLAVNYTRTWSPQFLLFQGGTHPHFNVPGFGNFWMMEILLLILGLGWVIKKHCRLGGWLIAVLILAPIPAAITIDMVHSTREIFLLPTVQILAAAGAMVLINKGRTKTQREIILGVIILALIVQAIPFGRYYWSGYKQVSDEKFTGYMRDISLYTQTQLDNYPNIFVTYPFESPYMFYAFYTRMDPERFLDTVSYYPTDQQGFEYAKSLGRIQYLANNRDLLELPKEQLKQSLVFSRVEEARGIQPIKTWYSQEGKPEIIAFEGRQLVNQSR
jgi:hypothetical protein